MKKKILFPTDFSDRAERAVGYVLQLFEKQTEMHGLKAIFLHVNMPITAIHPEVGVYVDTAVQAGENVQIKKRKLSDLISKWSKEYPLVSFEEMFIDGPVAPTIREVAADARVDLIAMGASGLGPIERSVLGSTSTAICHTSPCPVIVVPEGATARVPKRGIFATDFKNLGDVHILDPLKDIARDTQMDLMLLHIYQHDQLKVEENVELVDELNEYFETDHFDYYFLEDQDKLTAIEDFTTGYHADLLTVVAQERSFFEDLFHRSLTRQLVFRSKVPLLVLHPLFWDSEKDDHKTFREKVDLQMKFWRSEIDRLKMQSRLGQMEVSDAVKVRRAEIARRLHDLSHRLDTTGDVARDRWQHFQKEMSQAFSHIKKSLQKTD